MAFRISYLFLAVMLGYVRCDGENPTPPADQPPPPGGSGVPTVTAAPECAPLTQKTHADMPFATGESIYWVGKIYINPTAAADNTQAGDKPCSVATWTADNCEAIKILVSRDEDGTLYLKQAASNKKTKGVDLFADGLLFADPDKAIMKQFFGYYGTMNETGVINIVDPSPPEVKATQDADLVLVGAEKGQWALISTCTKSVAFILYSDASVCAKSTNTFEGAITPLLDPLGIKSTDFKDVPTQITTKLDLFIPSLPAAATPGANPTPPGANPTPPGANPTPLEANTTPPGANPTPPGATPPGANPTPPGANTTPPGANPTPPEANPTPPGANPTTPGANPTPPKDD